MWHYFADSDAVNFTSRHLQKFLATIQEHSGAKTIYLIAHSLGTRALTQALREIGEDIQHEDTPPPFHQVVLNAPDIDVDVFRELAKEITKTSKRVTLFSSSNDKALALSKILHGGHPRKGGTIGPFPGVEIIDVSQFETEDLFGHSYYDALIDDLKRLFHGVFSPEERHLLKGFINGKLYWKLPSRPVQ